MKIGFSTGNYEQSRDSLFIFMQECIKRGWKTYLFILDDIYEKDNKVYAEFQKITKVELDKNKKYIYEEKTTKELDFLDCIYFKRDPPIPIDKTKLLTKYENKVFFVNKPSSILKFLSKSNQVLFEKYMLPTNYSKNITEIIKQIKKIKDCVLKEDNSKGGKGIHRIQFRDNKFYVSNVKTNEKEIEIIPFLEKITENQTKLVTITNYLKNISKGDKRIIVVNEKHLGIILRKPKDKKGWICNISSGGRVEKSEITTEEIIIAKEVSKILTPQGIYVFGLDTLTGNNNERILSEVNTTNLGSFHMLISLYNYNPAKDVMDFVEDEYKRWKDDN